MFLLDDVFVSIPAEAVEYIEAEAQKCPSKKLLIFEVIEAFFFWLNTQPLETQRQVLRKALINNKEKLSYYARGY